MRWPGGPATFRARLLPGLVLIWTLLAFLPVVRNDFVNWDDFRMFLDNPADQGSWAARLRGAWALHRLGEYMPVTWMKPRTAAARAEEPGRKCPGEPAT